MKILTAVTNHRIWYREEPLSEIEAEILKDQGHRNQDEEGSVFAVFFVVQKQGTADLVKRIESDAERLGASDFFTWTLTRKRYTSIILSLDCDSCGAFESGKTEQRFWMACMLISKDFEEFGATLFSPPGFLEFDSKTFASLVKTSDHINATEYLARRREESKVTKTSRPPKG